MDSRSYQEVRAAAFAAFRSIDLSESLGAQGIALLFRLAAAHIGLRATTSTLHPMAVRSSLDLPVLGMGMMTPGLAIISSATTHQGQTVQTRPLIATLSPDREMQELGCSWPGPRPAIKSGATLLAPMRAAPLHGETPSMASDCKRAATSSKTTSSRGIIALGLFLLSQAPTSSGATI